MSTVKGPSMRLLLAAAHMTNGKEQLGPAASIKTNYRGSLGIRDHGESRVSLHGKCPRAIALFRFKALGYRYVI